MLFTNIRWSQVQIQFLNPKQPKIQTNPQEIKESQVSRYSEKKKHNKEKSKTHKKQKQNVIGSHEAEQKN